MCLHFDYQGRNWQQNTPCFLQGRDGCWTGLDYLESEVRMRHMETVYYCAKCTRAWGELVWHGVDTVNYCATCTRAQGEPVFHGEPIFHAVDEGLTGD